MAATTSWAKRGITKGRNCVTAIQGQKAGAAITPNSVLIFSAANTVIHCTEEATEFAGVSMDEVASGAPVEPVRMGPVIFRAGAIIEAGDKLKPWTDGSVAPYVDASESGDTIHTSAAGIAFTNQPANDGVEVVSDDAGDTTQTVTIIGTTTGTDTVVAQTVALNGTTFAATAKTDWGQILAVKLDAAAAGTVTVREASGDQTITTLAAGVLSKGVETVTNVYAGNVAPTVVASGATTKQIGLQGTNSGGSTIYDSQALSGATAVTMNSSFRTVTEVYTGDLEATRTVTVKIGAVESNPATIIGQAAEAAAAIGDTFLGIAF